MGNKRKYKDRDHNDSHIRRKIRRLKDKLRHEYYYSSDEEEDDYDRTRSPSPALDYGPPHSSDWEESDDEHIRSVVIPPRSATTVGEPTPAVTASQGNATSGTAANASAPPAAPSTSAAAPATAAAGPAEAAPTTSASPAVSAPAPLPAHILEALGDPKARDELFGPKVQDEISKRWGRVLVDGLSKEQRLAIQEKILFPENFKLAKAPALNAEIAPVLSESVRNRDRLLEKSQNVLGRGVAGLTNLTSCLIDNEMEKVEIIKRLSDVSQIFLDLHYDNTKTRRKLIVSSLDKKFTSMIADVKRDEFLFGANLGDKIKASKTAERSGLQVRRSDAGGPSRKPSYHSGNWRGPPRYQGASRPRRGGPRSRYWSQTSRRPPPPAERHAEPAKPAAKPRRPPQ